MLACQSIPDLKLDCMVKDYAVWPTWISPLYPESQSIGNLDVDLRLFDVGNGGGQFWGDGGVGLIFKPLFQLLNGFFHHGPRFFGSKSKNGVPGRNIHVNTLCMTLIHERPGERYNPLYDQKRICGSCWSALLLVADSGLLLGKVKMLQLCWGDEIREVEVKGTGEGRNVAEWDRYEFHWGL